MSFDYKMCNATSITFSTSFSGLPLCISLYNGSIIESVLGAWIIESCSSVWPTVYSVSEHYVHNRHSKPLWWTDMSSQCKNTVGECKPITATALFLLRMLSSKWVTHKSIETTCVKLNCKSLFCWINSPCIGMRYLHAKNNFSGCSNIFSDPFDRKLGPLSEHTTNNSIKSMVKYSCR